MQIILPFKNTNWEGTVYTLYVKMYIVTAVFDVVSFLAKGGKQMLASVRGVRPYLKFRQECSFTCHWLLIYSLDGPILFLWYQFLLTVALLTTSFHESLYNYDC